MMNFKREQTRLANLKKEIHNKRLDFIERLCFALVVGLGGYTLSAFPRLIRDYPEISLRENLPNLFAGVLTIAFFYITLYIINRRK